MSRLPLITFSPLAASRADTTKQPAQGAAQPRLGRDDSESPVLCRHPRISSGPIHPQLHYFLNDSVAAQCQCDWFQDKAYPYSAKKETSPSSTPTTGSAGVYEARGGPEARSARPSAEPGCTHTSVFCTQIYGPLLPLTSSHTQTHTSAQQIEMKDLNINLVNYEISKFKLLEIHCLFEQQEQGLSGEGAEGNASPLGSPGATAGQASRALAVSEPSREATRARDASLV